MLLLPKQSGGGCPLLFTSIVRTTPLQRTFPQCILRERATRTGNRLPHFSAELPDHSTDRTRQRKNSRQFSYCMYEGAYPRFFMREENAEVSKI